MIVKNENKDFEKFQEILEAVDYPKIPKNPSECENIDSYSLFQVYIKGSIKLEPGELSVLSKYVPVEKYYWTSVSMFPGQYLTYNNGKECKELYDLNEQEKADFESQVREMVNQVYKHQEEMGVSLESKFLDIGDPAFSVICKLCIILRIPDHFFHGTD